MLDGINTEITRLYEAGKYDEAIPLAERALATAEQMLGPDHPDVAVSLNNLALLHCDNGDYAKAEPFYQRALAITEKALGPDHPDVATIRNNLAELYRVKGDYAKAEPLYQRALAVDEAAFGPDHLGVAITLNNLASLYCDKGDYARAEPLYQRALMIREQALGPDHFKVAASLNNLALLYKTKGDYAKAEPLYQRALAITKKALGPDHPDVATTLNNLALLHCDKGDYAKAELLYQRALAITEKALGPDHLGIALNLNNLASLYVDKGDYAKAEPLYQRALAIREKALGPDHPDVATTLNNLALLHCNKGDYAKAELLYQRTLAIDEAVLGPNHPDVATTLNNLASLYCDKGDYARAEPLYQRALAITEKALGPDHPDVAVSLNNLALLHCDNGDYAKAEPFYQRALAITEKALGPDHPDVAISLNNLALLYRSQGDYAKAEWLHQRALAITEKALGSDHPDVAVNLNNLALLYNMKDDHAKAEMLYQRALAITEKALGPDHPAVAISLNNLALVYEEKGEVAQTIALCARAANIYEHNITLSLVSGSERQRFLYMALFLKDIHHIISLHLQLAPNDAMARRLALTTILRHKGRVLDATADSIRTLRQRFSPQDRALLDQLIDIRSQLATLALGGPGQSSPAPHQTQIEGLEVQAENLEAQISAHSREFRVQSQPVTLAAIQAAIPAGTVLLEFISFRPYDAKKHKWGLPSYVVYVLGDQGEPAWVNLGEAAEIDKLVNDLRAVLCWDGSDIEHNVKLCARALDQKIMQPVRKLLGDKRTLLISPDGALNLIPFAVLVDEQDKYMIESYSLTYLTAGRDLLRLQTKMESKQGATIFADPDFEAVQAVASSRDLTAIKDFERPPDGDSAAALFAGVASPSPSPAHDFLRSWFFSLSGTADEAEALKKLFPDAVVWMQAEATKTRLKQVSAPAVLHIATHGFFLDDAIISAAEVRSRGLLIPASQPRALAAPEFRVEDPLLRSGLALAGANLHFEGNYEGILTAKEASGLNLWGTKLVVLSACDTGVGDVRNGEGVYGLRRALVLAGSESQVMSLWPVDDIGTRDLMIDYYKALKARQGRGEALRQVQLRMLKSKDRKHPYYWASFIQSGEWASLDGKR